jgi:hypothetical protein
VNGAVLWLAATNIFTLIFLIRSTRYWLKACQCQIPKRWLERLPPMHRLEVEISGGHSHGLRGDITFKGVCDAKEGAPCRMWCNDPDCREEAGDNHDKHVRVDQGECGVIGTLNADPSMIPELYEGPKAPLRSGFIDLVQDIDGVTWLYGHDAPQKLHSEVCAENCRHQCPECRLGLGSHLTCDPRCEHRLVAPTR